MIRTLFNGRANYGQAIQPTAYPALLSKNYSYFQNLKVRAAAFVREVSSRALSRAFLVSGRDYFKPLPSIMPGCLLNWMQVAFSPAISLVSRTWATAHNFQVLLRSLYLGCFSEEENWFPNASWWAGLVFIYVADLRALQPKLLNHLQVGTAWQLGPKLLIAILLGSEFLQPAFALRTAGSVLGSWTIDHMVASANGFSSGGACWVLVRVVPNQTQLQKWDIAIAVCGSLSSSATYTFQSFMSSILRQNRPGPLTQATEAHTYQSYCSLTPANDSAWSDSAKGWTRQSW